jgi:hypothetical protein
VYWKKDCVAMVNPKTGTVVTIPRPKVLTPVSGNTEQPKEFVFSVTWETLLAVPQPLDVVDTIPTTAAMVVAAPLEIIPREAPVHALQVVEPPPRPRRDEAAWEMVVPKMVRRQS